MKESNPRCSPLCAFSRQGQTQSVLSVFTGPACIDSVAFMSNVNTYFLLISGTEAFKDIDYFLRQPTHFFFFFFIFSPSPFLLKHFACCCSLSNSVKKGPQRSALQSKFNTPKMSSFFVISLALILLVLNSSTQDFQILYVSAFRWCCCIQYGYKHDKQAGSREAKQGKLLTKN